MIQDLFDIPSDAHTGSLDRLLEQTPGLWRGAPDSSPAPRESHQSHTRGISTGHQALDQLLPWQGWPTNGLVDIVSADPGIGELQLLMPLLRKLSQQQKPMLWITPPYQLYAPALAQAGVDTRHIVLIQPQDSCQHALWSAEKALQSAECALVLLWQNWLSARVMRRLQLAARSGNTLGVLFHQRPLAQSPAALQLQLQAAPANATDSTRALDVHVTRARGTHYRGCTRINLVQRFP